MTLKSCKYFRDHETAAHQNKTITTASLCGEGGGDGLGSSSRRDMKTGLTRDKDEGDKDREEGLVVSLMFSLQ